MIFWQIIRSLKKSCLSIKFVSKTVKNKAKEQKEEFLSMLLGTLGASSLGNLLAGKGTNRTGEETIIGSEGTIRASQDF